MNKKNLFYGLGTISVLTAPIASVIACSSPKPTPDKSKADKLANDLAKINTSSLSLEEAKLAVKDSSKTSLQHYGIKFELDGSNFLFQGVEYSTELKIIITFKIAVNKDESETKKIKLTKFNTQTEDKQQADQIVAQLKVKDESTKTFEYLETLNKSAKFSNLGINHDSDIDKIFEIIEFKPGKESKKIEIKFKITINESKSDGILTLSKFNTEKEDNATANKIAEELSKKTQSTLTFEQVEHTILDKEAKNMSLKDYGVDYELQKGATLEITEANLLKDSKKRVITISFRIKFNKSESDQSSLKLSVFKNEDKKNADKMAFELAAINTSNKSFTALKDLSTKSKFADLGITYDLPKNATFTIVEINKEESSKTITIKFKITVNKVDSDVKGLKLTKFDTTAEDKVEANRIATEMVSKITSSTKTFEVVKAFVGNNTATFKDLGITYDLQKDAKFVIDEITKEDSSKTITIKFKIIVNESESEIKTLTITYQ